MAACLLLCAGVARAQEDPVVMTINGQPVSRSEFEYSYNKNNAEGVIDKKTVEEYVDLFINYKLKVQAALDERLDTLSSFRKEFLGYRDEQIRPSFVTDADIDAEAVKYYDRMVEQIGPKGLFTASHILLSVPQKASGEAQDSVRLRADSLYNAIRGGADFAEMARKYSQDPRTAENGGLLPTLAPGQTVKEFEDVAYSLGDGEMSRPFLSPFGYHIIKMKERSQVPPLDSIKGGIVRFLESRGLRDRIVNGKLDAEAKASGGTLTAEDILNRRAEKMQEEDSDLKNLIMEYHDGLLLFEISSREVWDKAAKDEAGLAMHFKKNRKKYKWDSPRFKGIAYHVKEQADVKAVRDCVRKIPFERWADTLRKAFNNDSVIRIRVEKGIFKQGDNALVDKMVFGKDVKVAQMKNYPIDATYGKKIKAPQTYEDVRGLVVADYQDELEKAWVEQLRKKYEVKVDKEVLATVNRH